MNRSRNPIKTHPVDGYTDNSKLYGTNKSIYCVPHKCMPGLNTYFISKINNINDAVQYYSVPNQFNLPMPYIPFSEIDLKINAVLDLVNLKTRWKFQYEQLLKACRRKFDTKKLNNMKKNILECTDTKIPILVAHLTTKLMEDPDQYFNSEYNWYYKNTIDKFQFNEKWYLAYARGVNLDNLDIISISNNKYCTVETKEDNIFEGPIFDIKFSNPNDLMVRQKAKLFIFRNNSETDILLDNKIIYDNYNIPYTDADITANNFFTADVKHVLKQWKDGICIQDKYFDVEYDQSDSFLRISYFQNQSDNMMAIINRQKLYLTDSRIDISKHCSVYDPNTITEVCEELAALKISNLNEHSIYVATNHTVLTLDRRIGFINKSYHMLSNPPSLITTHNYENGLEPNEILFLGTHIGESIVNLSYTSIQDDFLECKTMVSSIPKPLESLHNVRLQGHCLNPILLERFARCLTGITAIGTNDRDLRLFSINCVGDLFVQQINDTTPLDVAEFKKNVTIKSHSIPNLNYSHVFDMSKLWHLEKPKKNDEHDVKQNTLWSISKKEMTSYVDHLAPLLLCQWDIDDLSEWGNTNDDIDTANDDSDCDYKTKVNYWFNKNDNLLRMEKHPNANINVDSQQNISSSAVPTRSDQEDEISDNSSSGYTVSLKSD
ncbi:Hypothetical protein CINCED_3A012380 [Cinara cedri]|uniref:Uncharacterized protein n=1 Tax=Cinara cedri TaxID=506608 RepID=A0A5E4M377_9HEMI|nr:Hypothetical protein CINCED_3A012380 [Cinara cedri]